MVFPLNQKADNKDFSPVFWREKSLKTIDFR